MSCIVACAIQCYKEWGRYYLGSCREQMLESWVMSYRIERLKGQQDHATIHVYGSKTVIHIPSRLIRPTH
jgi:hypothetical protein